MEALHVWDNHGGCKSRIDFKLRINTDHFKLILKRYNSHRGRALLRSLSISTSPVIEVVRWRSFYALAVAKFRFAAILSIGSSVN